MSQKSIFISYAREDVDAAKRLYEDLKVKGFEPWIDMESILPGEKWKITIKKAIENSRYFIALLSSKSVTRRGFIHKEISEALEFLETFPQSDIYLIPIRLDDCQPSHDSLGNIHWVDMFPSWEKGLSKLLSSINRDNVNKPEVIKQKLEITDIIVDSYRSDFTAILDFRVINRGQTNLIINRLQLVVVKVERICTLGALKFSDKYDLDISNLINNGDKAEVAVSHVLSPDEADRFLVTLTAKELGMGVFRIWELKTILLTSEGPSESFIKVGLPWDLSETSRHPGM